MLAALADRLSDFIDHWCLLEKQFLILKKLVTLHHFLNEKNQTWLSYQDNGEELSVKLCKKIG